MAMPFVSTPSKYCRAGISGVGSKTAF